jgi:hypothetical protein
MNMSTELKPAYVVTLENVYGAPSQAGFGSAVFFERDAGDLEKFARAQYKFFVGKNWEHFGEKTWLRQWKQVYARPANAKHDIVAELNAIADANAKNSVPMILENIENADAARQALAHAFDDTAMSQVLVFNIGDGEAMSGILVAGQRTNGETTALVFLLD